MSVSMSHTRPETTFVARAAARTRLLPSRRYVRRLGRPRLELLRRAHRRRRARPPRRATSRARARTAGRSARRTASRTPARPASRGGSRTPTPAQSTRAAFSAMSPAGRARHHRAAGRERAHQRPVAAVADDHVAQRHRLRVGQPRHQHGVRAAPSIGAGGSRPFVGRDHAHRLVAPARPAPRAAAGARGSCEVDGATSTTGPSPGGGSTRSPGGSHMQRPDHAHPRLGQRARVLELRERRRPASARARAPLWTYGSGASPSRARASLYSSRPCSSAARTKRRSARRHSARPSARARQPRADRVDREARRRRAGRRAGRASPRGTPSSSAASAGAGREDVRHRRRRARTRASNGRVSPRRPHRRLVRLQRLVRRREHLVLRRRRERHPRRLDGLAPASPRLAAPPRARARPARSPSAIIGNAWPGSPKAPRKRPLKRPARPRAAAARAGPRTSTPSARPSACRRPRRGRPRAARARTSARPAQRDACRSARRAAPRPPRPSCPSRYRSWTSRAASSNP